MKTILPPSPSEILRRREERILQEWLDDVEHFNQSEEYYVHEQRGKDVQNKQRESGIARKAVAYRTPEERQGSWTAETQNAQRNQKPARRSGRIYIRFLNSLCLCVTLVMFHLFITKLNFSMWICFCISFGLYEWTRTAVIEDICNEEYKQIIDDTSSW